MTTATAKKPAFTDYIVKDISLAEFGRKEISLAETEMPGHDGLSISRQPTQLRNHTARFSVSARSVFSHENPPSLSGVRPKWP